MLLRGGSLLGLAFLCVFDSSACEVPPRGYSVGHAQAVDESEMIFLGTVIELWQTDTKIIVLDKISSLETDENGALVLVDADPIEFKMYVNGYEVTYLIRVDECLKGICEASYSIGGSPATAADHISTTGRALASAKHEGPGFWNEIYPAGRVPGGSDCRFHPSFSEGQQYLIFSDRQTTIGSELIIYPDDKWLSFVRDEVASE